MKNYHHTLQLLGMFRQLLILLLILVYCGNNLSAQEKPATASLSDITNKIRQDVHLEDKVIGIRGEEGEVYYDILRKLVELPVGELEQGARSYLGHRFKKDFSQGVPRELPVYADMHFHMPEYQGQPVVIRGHTQRILPLEIDPPYSGLTRLYEIWLFTDDSQRNPTVVISPGLPDGFKPGDEIQDHLKVTGVLFKKYIYKAQDQVRFAPLILAGELSYDPPTFKPLSQKPVTLFIVGLFILLFIIVAGAVFIFLRKPGNPSETNLGLPEKINLEGDGPPVNPQ